MRKQNLFSFFCHHHFIFIATLLKASKWSTLYVRCPQRVFDVDILYAVCNKVVELVPLTIQAGPATLFLTLLPAYLLMFLENGFRKLCITCDILMCLRIC